LWKPDQLDLLGKSTFSGAEYFMEFGKAKLLNEKTAKAVFIVSSLSRTCSKPLPSLFFAENEIFKGDKSCQNTY